MADLLDKLEAHFRGQYEVDRSDIQHGKRLTVKHLEQVVNVDLFTTGKPQVSGKGGPLKEEVGRLVDGFRKDRRFFEKLEGRAGETELETPEGAILRHITQELFDFLQAHDRQALVAAQKLSPV